MDSGKHQTIPLVMGWFYIRVKKVSELEESRGEMGDCVNIHDNISSALDIESPVPPHFSISEHQLNIFSYLQCFLKTQYTAN